MKADERDILQRFYPTPYFFSARVFGQIDLVSVELQKVYRQTDNRFIGVLDHIRNNTITATDLQLLNTRHGIPIARNEEDMYITLATRRDVVDHINTRKLEELPGEVETFFGVREGEFPESSLPTAMELTLKVGAQIIFIKNDFERRWVNGTIGTISGLDTENGTLYIITENGKECDVKQKYGAISATPTTKSRKKSRKKFWEPSNNSLSNWHGLSLCTKAKGLPSAV